MSFPTSPTNGQKANVNGVTYVYNSTLTAWTVSSMFNEGITANVIVANNITSTGNIIGESISGNVTYDNTVTNRLDATDVQGAVDEMVGFFTATVTGSNGNSDWSGSDPSVATITVSGIKSSDRPIVDLDLSAVAFGNVGITQGEWTLVYRVEASGDDEIKLYATEEPIPTFSLQIKVVR